MTVAEKIETSDSKIEQNKVPYNLDRQTVKISTLLIKTTFKSTLSKFNNLQTRRGFPKEKK